MEIDSDAILETKYHLEICFDEISFVFILADRVLILFPIIFNIIAHHYTLFEIFKTDMV